MSAEQRVRRLEALLERVRKNAQRPRSAAPASAQAAPEAQPAPLEPVPSAPAVSQRSQKVLELVVEPTSDVEAAQPYPEVQASEPAQAQTFEDVEEIEEVSADYLETVPPQPVASVGSEDAEEEREAPSSSRRPRIPADAEAFDDSGIGEEHEVPIKTPPPESGPQEAPVPLGYGGAPTPEQLGESIDLGEAGGASLELDHPPSPAPPVVEAPSELEAVLPAAGRAPSAVPAQAPPEESAQAEPELLSRPTLESSEVLEVSPTPPSVEPRSFLELLDASLSLEP